MYRDLKIIALIPVLNEEGKFGEVVRALDAIERSLRNGGREAGVGG